MYTSSVKIQNSQKYATIHITHLKHTAPVGGERCQYHHCCVQCKLNNDSGHAVSYIAVKQPVKIGETRTETLCFNLGITVHFHIS